MRMVSEGELNNGSDPKPNDGNIVGGKTNPPIKQRVGVFRIPTGKLWPDIDFLCQVFGELQFVPLRVEHLFASQELNCVGVSPKFEPIGPGAMPNKYMLTAKRSPEGNLEELTVNKEA
jgi:hypothetical protein